MEEVTNTMKALNKGLCLDGGQSAMRVVAGENFSIPI